MYNSYLPKESNSIFSLARAIIGRLTSLMVRPENFGGLKGKTGPTDIWKVT